MISKKENEKNAWRKKEKNMQVVVNIVAMLEVPRAKVDKWK